MHTTIDEKALQQLIAHFYARVRADDLIGPLFNEVVDDWPAHLDKLQSFWSGVMLASGRYKGRPLPAHVQHGDRMSGAAFDRWLALWRHSTDEMFQPGPARASQDKADRIAESLQLGIRFARGDGLRRENAF